MLESQVESKLVRLLKKKGIYHIKLSALGIRGLPDRLILLPGGKAIFIELKAPGREKNLSPNQEVAINRLKILRFPVLVSSNADECLKWIEEFIDEDV